MRYHALATDYDGTLATHGAVPDHVRAGLGRLRATGRRILLVTGRRIDDLVSVCPDLDPFEIVVAENGAVLYWPSTREVRALAEPPPPLLLEALEARGVPDVARGHVIVATWQPHQTTVLETIRELGLEMQVIFNKGAVMILPSGVNKGTGLRAALEAMGLSPHNVVGVGDAENDHALLSACECGVAVANALPMLRERADLVTRADHGDGVLELAERLIENDLADLTGSLSRHDLPIGFTEGSVPVTLPAFGSSVLLAGTSGGGKSTFATAFLERLQERAYQFCILDPEGDHGELPGVVVMGSHQDQPGADQILKLIEDPRQNAVVNLIGLGLEDRPRFFDGLMPRLQAQRVLTGHPHWLVIDEVHHLAPQSANFQVAASGVSNLFLITVHPKHVAPTLLSLIDVAVVVGASPSDTLCELARALGVAVPEVEPGPLASGEALLWWPRRPERPVKVHTILPQAERRRHIRKYAEGELPAERSFFFRGPEAKLNLRAQNLTSFIQLGEGVDDETWRHHLRRGDYSRWLLDAIKDRELSEEVAAIERSSGEAPASESRRAVKGAIDLRYTASS